MFKKHLPITLSLLAVLLLLAVMGMTACRGSQQDTCSHVFEEWVVDSQPDCYNAGWQHRSCACGYTEEQSIPPTGHIEVTNERVEPTCTQSGLTEGSHCGACGLILVQQEYLEPLGHDAVIDPYLEAT